MANERDLRWAEHDLRWAELLLSRLPVFDPGWTESIQERWWDAFDRLRRALDEEKGVVEVRDGE